MVLLLQLFSFHWVGTGKINKKNSKGIGEYWKPIDGLTQLVRGQNWPQSRFFKYGGTGGSILDTNMWLLDSQVLRLAKDLSSWSKIDDLWSSYVLDALLGWEIRRLSPGSMPIDIGAYRENKYYRRYTSVRISDAAKHQLMKLPLPEKKSILQVATWSDPNVDKQDMFEELQRTFLWEIEQGPASEPSSVNNLSK